MQPPASSSESHAVPKRLAWYRRWDLLLLVAVLSVTAGSLGTWFGLDWYARKLWAEEMARQKAAALPYSTIEKMAPAVHMSRAGVITALFSPRLMGILKERDLFQESPLLFATDKLGINREDHRNTFNELFTRFPIKALARALREGAFEPEDLSRLALLPLRIRELRNQAAWELQVHMNRISMEGEAFLNMDNPGTAIEVQLPKAHPLVRYGPHTLLFLPMIELLHDLKSRREFLAASEANRRLTLPKQLPEENFRLTPLTVQVVSTELDCIAGALISNMQRIIIAFAQYRATHERNPKNVTELLEDESVRNKLIAIEGAELDFVVEPGTGKVTLRYMLEPKLCELIHQCEAILSENWDTSTAVNVVSAVLFDKRDAPAIKAKEEKE
ncbi:MAG TPA: hypothetical protein VK970_07545 [Candidatus Methylacidiphilales bacterium]|nr:hypothetical protein [Candidatus Methylacidiphilales bacterium]